jgi:hypothetical protein
MTHSIRGRIQRLESAPPNPKALWTAVNRAQEGDEPTNPRTRALVAALLPLVRARLATIRPDLCAECASALPVSDLHRRAAHPQRDDGTCAQCGKPHGNSDPTVKMHGTPAPMPIDQAMADRLAKLPPPMPPHPRELFKDRWRSRMTGV